MEALLHELSFERAKTLALQKLYDDENVLRLKAEGSLHELRRIHQTLACSCEMSEEFIVNKLICKIERAKFDKEKLAIDLEREEECLTNNLQRQLSASISEKGKTAAEVVELKKQLEKMRSEQEQIARKVEAEQELLSNNLFKKLQKSLQEKTELENQLSRAISARNSQCSSLNSSITGFPDSPVTAKERSELTDDSASPIKKNSDPIFVSPKRKISVSGAGATRLPSSPHNTYI